MVFDFDIIPYYRELLVKAIPENSSTIDQCILKGWFKDLAKTMEIDSMRLYLYDDKNDVNRIFHICGDKEIWKNVDITRFRKPQTKFKRLFFVKIRYIRENGVFLTLGYLAFYTERYVSPHLLYALDVLCMLYGNYIVKRLVGGQYAKIGLYLPKVYEISSSELLAGTKIQKLLSSFTRLVSANYGIYCTICNDKVSLEYYRRGHYNGYPQREISCCVEDTFIRTLADNSMISCNASHLPQPLTKMVLHRERRPVSKFYTKIYPVHIDNEVIGFWLFLFSINNPYAEYDLTTTLDTLSNQLRNTYRILFQRRFNAMIVNPIFQNRDTRIKEGSVFVIMPFTQTWSNDVWEQVIKPSVNEVGMQAVRADDLYGANIMEDVWQSILQAAIIICDTTGRNPNVFYELGIAHTLGKKVLLLTQNIDDIPFDLQAYRHIQYSISISGGNQLKDKIKKYIKETLGF